MKLYIKNMVCNRCKMVVKEELTQLGLNPIDVQLGVVTVNKELSAEMTDKIKDRLNHFGFSLLEDRKQQLAEQIKTAVINLVHYANGPLKVNLSTFLSDRLGLDYPYLSSVFTAVEQQTIEHYFIAQKIEKAKEMLTYGEQTLSEIAFALNYSSVAHLSAQFKKVTGRTPSAYKAEQEKGRKPLDEV